MRLQPASALTEGISGKKGAIKFRARSDKRGRIEKRNKQTENSSLSPMLVDQPFSF